MKKLISVVLVLAMLASMMVYLPLGASATGAATTIYSEDFDGLESGYTLEELADLLGWTLIRGDDTATVEIVDGKLTIDATDATYDVVFEVANDAALLQNHTIQYDMEKSFHSGNLSFAGMYTGTDNGETVKAIINKTTYENYNHMALADGVINEINQRAAGYKIGGGSYDQCRPENIPGGGDSNTWKVVYDVTNNQVDGYAAGGRINSTVGAIDSADAWAAVNVADYVGEGAYIRVQKTGCATFDNISIVTGGEAVSYGEYAYYQDFSAIPNGTYTGAELAALTGFQTFADSTSTAEMVYTIANGRLEIVANGDCTNSYMFKNNQQFATLYVPEMETAQDAVVIEYDMTYLYDENVTGSSYSGDVPLGIEMYGRRSDFHAFWQFTPKGFPMYGFYKGSHVVDGTSYSVTQNGEQRTDGYYTQSQGRYEDTYFNATYGANSVTFSNGTYHHSLYGSTEHIKVVLSVKDGMFIYVNGVCAIQLSETSLAAWRSTKTSDAYHIIGNLLRFRVPAGCHIALDNIKISADPAPIAGPDLWLTEASCGVEIFNNSSKFSGSEYVEVYNASNKAINIYDYALTQRAYSNSLDNIGTAIGLRDITLMYPGTHTFKSIMLADDGVNPLYTYDVTNPAYADGWLQPGEVAVLWNKTDAMHNGAETAPTVITDSTKPNYGMGNWGAKTVADFRAALAIPETTKVFQMYNDYNRAFNNSGSHFVALVDRDLVQPGYDAATGTGDETLTAAAIGFADYKSTILDVTADTNSGRTVKTVTYASYDATEAVGLSEVVFSRPDSALTAEGMTPGYLKNSQKKAFTITVDGKAHTAYLGETITPADFAGLEGFEKLLWAEVDGELVTADEAYTVMADMTINNGAVVAMTTLAGAGVRVHYDANTGLRWVTAINEADLEALNARDDLAAVEFGTLLAKTEELAEYENEFTIDYVTDDGTDGKVVRKIVGYDGEWYGTTADYNGFGLFAGGIGNMNTYNYSKDYRAVGYLTVTLEGGETFTVYGDFDADKHERSAVEVLEAAIADYETNHPDTYEESEDYNRLVEYLAEAE